MVLRGYRSWEMRGRLGDKQVTSRNTPDWRQQWCGFGTNKLPLIAGTCGPVPRAGRWRRRASGAAPHRRASGAAPHRLAQWRRAEVSRFLTALLCCLFSLEYSELSALIVSNSIFSKGRTPPLPPSTRLTPRGSRSAPSCPRGAWKALKPVKTNGATKFTSTRRLSGALRPREGEGRPALPGGGGRDGYILCPNSPPPGSTPGARPGGFGRVGSPRTAPQGAELLPVPCPSAGPPPPPPVPR